MKETGKIQGRGGGEEEGKRESKREQEGEEEGVRKEEGGRERRRRERFVLPSERKTTSDAYSFQLSREHWLALLRVNRHRGSYCIEGPLPKCT